MNKIIVTVVIAFVLTACCNTYTITPMSSNQMAITMNEGKFVSTNNISFMYRIYVPETERRIPIVFYLHGAGQRGTDNVAQLDVGSGSFMSLTTEKDDYKAIVVAPQCPNGVYWRDDIILDALAEFICKMSTMSNVDVTRIYVTGYSMGGDATWKLAVRYPNIFTSAMPICGGPLETMEPDRPVVLKETALLNIWAFNNYDDTIVRPNFSKYMFSKIWNYDINDNLNFTESIDGGHDASNVYRNRKYMIWLMSTKSHND